MKYFFFLLLIFVFSSCNQWIINEEIISEKKLEALVNYEVGVIASDEERVSLSVMKDFFDKSQLGPNCVSPLKSENQYLTISFKDSIITQYPNIPANFKEYTYFSNNTIFNYSSEIFSNVNRQIINTYDEKFTWNHQNIFDLSAYFTQKFEYINYNIPNPSSDGNFFIIGNSNNYQKENDAELVVAKTLGGSIQYTGNYVFKGIKNFGVWKTIEDKEGNLFIVTAYSEKESNLISILKFDVLQRKLILQKQINIQNYFTSRVKFDTEGNLMLIPTNLDFSKPEIVVYQPSKKEFITKKLNFDSNENWKTGYNFDTRMLDHSIFVLSDEKGNNTIAEVNNDYYVKTLFKPNFVNSHKFFPLTINKPFMMYELKYPGSEKSKEISIFQHTSITTQKKIILFKDHASVNRCYRFE